ncbi:MAG: DUF6350 family protein [Demequina sp.]
MSRSLAGDTRALALRTRGALAGVPGWVGGIIAGVQAAVLTLLVVLAPATAVVAAAPTPDGSVSVDWGAGIAVAFQVWLLAHGTAVETSLATFTLVPLGLTLVFAAIIAAVARRFAAPTWGSWLLVTAAYTTAVVLMEAATAGQSTSAAALTRTAMLAVLLAGPSAAVGIWRGHGAHFEWILRAPEQVRAGVRLGVGTTALLLLTASAATVVSAISGRHAIADAATSLGTDAVSGVVVAIAQTIYAPVLVIWMMAWVIGVGFTVGEGNVFAPSVVATDTLPTVPLLGALPTVAGGVLVWVPLVVAVMGAVAWWMLRHRWTAPIPAIISAAVAVLVVGMAVGLLSLAASGAAGPGTLATAGAAPWAAGVVAASLAGAGFAIAGAVTGGWRWLVSRPPTHSGIDTP